MRPFLLNKKLPNRFYFCIDKKNILFIYFIFFIHSFYGQKIIGTWNQLDKGIWYSEYKAIRTSNISDSKISVIKIDPSNYNFELKIASQVDSPFRTLPEWCEKESYIFGINAGMYSLANRFTATGFMRNGDYINNPVFKDAFNALLAFNPKSSSFPKVRIIDLINEKYEDYKSEYQCYVQSIRLIDNNGKAIYWSEKSKLSCSMTLLAIDKKGNILFLFTRSPYKPNDMIDFMLLSDLQIKTAMYLEGGPEASFYINLPDTAFGKFGSYVSQTYPTDKNSEFRKMPNIIGVKQK
ncbi:MAG: phosphodiester glycosidase family protein [Bacteroidales bacterium]|nr:phosphodiester glycosidase family protein [Bacteroidales bacterium]MDY0216680.1 phosphodiester glycosidase family protein [Bacteroidales bacterium]